MNTDLPWRPELNHHIVKSASRAVVLFINFIVWAINVAVWDISELSFQIGYLKVRVLKQITFNIE